MKKFTTLLLLCAMFSGQALFAGTESIPLNQVKQVADQRAASLWGSVNAAEPLAIYTQQDELIGYRFTYAVNAPFPDRQTLIRQCSEAAARGDKRAQWGNDRYGTIFLSARTDLAVYLQRSAVLSPEYAVGAAMEELAAKRTGGTVTLKRAYYVDFQNQWFCYTNGSTDIYVKAFPKLITATHDEFHALVDNLKFFTARGDFSAEWNKCLSGEMDAPAAQVMIPNHDGNCKFYDWSYGCSPTAAAMLLSYWDFVSAISGSNYSKLVDYHFSRYDDIQVEYDYQVPNTNKELAIYMNTDTTDGGTARSDIVPGYNTLCNTVNGYNFVNTDYGEESYTTCWARIVTEVGTNHRPIHVSIPGHSECCVGYDAATLEMGVHNTWWEGVDWQARTSLERVYTIVPGGSEGYSIVLASPQGDVIYNHNGSGETYYAGDVCEIRWSYDYAADSYVKLYYSVNGGGLWYTITSNTPNDGVYDWVIPAGINSTNCRIRALVYSSTGVFSGSDGSTGNFKIYSGGSLYTLSEDAWTTASTDPDYYQFTNTGGYWNVVGIRPNVAGEDWDIALYDDAAFTNQLAISAYGGSTVDFVVLDGNHTSTLARGIKANRYSGSGSGRVEWEGGADLTTPSTPFTETWTAGDVVEMWDVYLTPGYYKCTMLVNSGTANLGLAFFGSSGAAYYGARSNMIAGADSYGAGVGESFWVNITTADYYGLCIYANDANTANITVKFETQGQWLGDVSSDWFDPDNWSAAFVPTATVDVTINTGYTYYPIISSGVADCQNITIGAGTKLSIGSADLNVAGNMTIYGQAEQTNVNADFFVTGSVYWESGSTANITAGEFHVDGDWEFRSGAAAQLANGYVFFEGAASYSYIRSYDRDCAFKNLYNSKTTGYLYYSSSSTDTLKVNGFYENASATSLFYFNTNYPLVLKGQLYNYGHIYCPYGTFIFDGTTQYVDLNTGDYFNNLIISPATSVTMQDSLRVHGNLTISSGSLIAGTYPVLIEGNWTNNVGTAGFNEGTGKVVFNGGNYHQYCSNETFNMLEVDKPAGGAFRLNGTTVSCASYDWTAGAVDVLSGQFTANDLADGGISGSYYVNPGGTINLTNTDGYIDLRGYLYIYGGNFNVYSNPAYGDSYWPWGVNGGITMSDGVLDFKNAGIYVYNSLTYSLAENITGGTIRTAGGFRVDRGDFTPDGGTLEFYGATDGYLHTLNGGYVRNVLFNKSLSDQAGGTVPYLFDREGGTVSNAPLTGTVIVDGLADVYGNVTMQSGVLSVGSNTMYVQGNWDNQVGTAAFLEGTGTVEFRGSTAADILSAETFYNLNLNKTYAPFDGLELMYNVTCSNAMHLIDGTMEINYPANLTVGGNLTLEPDAGLNANDYTGLMVNVGGNWTDGNTTHSTTAGFEPGTSVVTFNGTTDQVMTSNCASVDFYNLVINKSAGRFRPYDNLTCFGNGTVTAGEWEDFITGLTHTIYGDLTVQAAGALYNASWLNTFAFTGSSNSILTYAGSAGYFHNLYINKTTGYSVTQVGNTSLQFSGDMTVENGIYSLNGYQLSVFGNTNINDLGVLNLPAGSTLVHSDGKYLGVNSGGRLETYGTSVTGVNLRANVTTARYAINIQSGGTLASEYTTYRHTGVNGVYLAPGSTLDPAHSLFACTFQDGASGGTMLGINNSQTLTIRNAVFPTNTWGAVSNVAKTINTGHVYFVDFSGGYSGEAYDADGYNLIDWVPTLTATATATPSTICAGSTSQLNVVRSGGLAPYTYSWTPTSGLSNPAIINPVANPAATTTYTVVVTDNLGTSVSSAVTLTVLPYLPVSVSITASANPSPPGSYVLFTATPVNGGTIPAYQWKVNGMNVGSGLSTYSYVPSYHDQVKCVLTSNYTCPTGNPATSNTIAMVVVNTNTSVTGTVPSPLTLCFDASNTVTVAGGGTTFTVQAGGSATMIAGVKISYLYGTTVQSGGYMHGYITTSNTYCGGAPKSIVAAGEEQETGETGFDVTAAGRFRVYPNPTNGSFILADKATEAPVAVSVDIFDMRGGRIQAVRYMYERTHSFDLSGLPAGLYFVQVTSGGRVESFKVVLTR